MAHSAFSQRFGYVLWLAHLRMGSTPKFTAIAEAVGRTQPAVSAWLTSDEPPPDWRVHEPLARYFGIEERWLMRCEGEAPYPELWNAWTKARSRDVRSAAPFVVAVPDTRARRKKPPKRSAG